MLKFSTEGFHILYGFIKKKDGKYSVEHRVLEF